MGASYDFWNLESRHPGILESPGFGWFLLITMYRVFFPLSFCPWTLFSMQNSKTLSSLKSSRNHLEFWNSFWKWPNFCQVQQIGCFSYAIFWPWTWFSTLAHTQRENLEFPGISLLLPFSKYRIFLLLSINPCTWFSMFQFKSPSFLESSWKYLEILNSSENGLILTKFEK